MSAQPVQTTSHILDEALAWSRAGVSVIPVNPHTKRPTVSWARWSGERATDSLIGTWFTGTDHGLGLVCGGVSGNLEMLEFEGRAIDLFTRAKDLMADHGLSELWSSLLAGCLESSPSGGVHLLYRVDHPVEGNTKIARRPAGNHGVDVLIETRGEGGYTVAAPTIKDHTSAWTRLCGGPETLPTITADQRERLHTILGLLDEVDTPTSAPVSSRQTAPLERPGGPTPLDDFNARTDWADILEPLGWTRLRRDGTGYQWVRPGKRPSDGISATTGRNNKDCLYIFSTSTDLPSEQPLTKAYVWAHYHCAGDMHRAAKELADAGYGTPRTPALTFTATTNTPASPSTAEDLCSDTANGTAMADRFADRLKWVPARTAWITWGQTRWVWCDDDAPAIQAAAVIGNDLNADTKTKAAWKRHSLSLVGLRATARIASTIPEMRVNPSDLDADPWALCTPGGIVDLHDATMRPATPEDLCTRQTAVTVDPTAKTPLWDRFLTDTFTGDVDMIGYLQCLAGMSALGQVHTHILPFMYGAGANGKSVFADVIVRILGDYASTAPAGFLMAGHDDESAIARLSGLRMVVCSEVNKRDRFDEAKVKLLTGGDALTARFLYGRHFTFTPTHTLWLMGNNKPRVEAGGESFWRRTRLIGFNHTVPKQQRIDDLADRLFNEEGPGILAWIVAGAVASQSGLSEPASVIAATQAYADEEDHLARFISDRVKLGGGTQVRTPTTAMRAAYVQWCRDEGEPEMSATMFGRELKGRWNVGVVKNHGKKLYTNVTLLGDDDTTDQGWSL